jgi:hypothetical protein
MPVKNCQQDNKPGYKWGDEGTCYIYNPNDQLSKQNAMKKAKKQGVAIEISKDEFESYNDYPKSASDAACRAIEYKEKYGSNCGTRVGWTRANQLCKREPISRDTIARMASFARHLQHKDIPYTESCGGIMVDAWGSETGIEWAQRKLEQIDRKDFSCSCGRGLEQHIQEIVFNAKLTEEQKQIEIENLVSYNDFITDIENTFDFNSIGKEYKTIESTPLHFYSIPKDQFNFRVINLYKYEPQPGSAPIIENTRRFCAQLYIRTQSQNNYLTFNELQSLANPGSEYGVRDILTYCGNYTTDPSYTTCRHRWIRYKYDTETGNIVRDITQPRYIRTISDR